MKRSRLSVVLATVALTVLGVVDSAQALTTTRFDLEPTNAGCLPDATGRVTVMHKEETLGVHSCICVSVVCRRSPPLRSS